MIRLRQIKISLKEHAPVANRKSLAGANRKKSYPLAFYSRILMRRTVAKVLSRGRLVVSGYRRSFPKVLGRTKCALMKLSTAYQRSLTRRSAANAWYFRAEYGLPPHDRSSDMVGFGVGPSLGTMHSACFAGWPLALALQGLLGKGGR